eukprot:TRINITY_DN43714_c0_g1_i1.p6 TRINITY_DN43714_c0_g1~~TRINITY_DN43714_c0_g1_i1.p6  ORF type:complete len:319 (+),score=122.47 TRINITY_DN43714_c0_g1_i1:1736-2692(+)
MHLHGEVADLRVPGQEFAVMGGGQRVVADQGHDGPQMARPQAPKMQVRDLVAGALFKGGADLLGQPGQGVHVQQHPARVAHEPPGPAGDDQRAHDAHHRVHPHPAQILARGQGGDGQQRGERVGQHVQIGGLQVVVHLVVVVGLAVVVGMVVTMAMAVIVVVAEHQGADQVDHQADHRHQDGLVKGDGHRIYQTRHRLIGHEHRDEAQQQGAGEPGQLAHLAGAETEAGVVGVAPGQPVAQGGDAQGGGVGGHVPAVGQQGHGAEDDARGHLHHHHHRGQGDDQAGAVLVARLGRAQKVVAVAVRLQMFRVQELSSIC